MYAIGTVAYVLLSGSFPFNATSRATLVQQQRRVPRCNSERWEGVSASAISFVQGLLEPDPAKRMTAREALKHPFLTEAAAIAGKLGLVPHVYGEQGTVGAGSTAATASRAHPPPPTSVRSPEGSTTSLGKPPLSHQLQPQPFSSSRGTTPLRPSGPVAHGGVTGGHHVQRGAGPVLGESLDAYTQAFITVMGGGSEGSSHGDAVAAAVAPVSPAQEDSQRQSAPSSGALPTARPNSVSFLLQSQPIATENAEVDLDSLPSPEHRTPEAHVDPALAAPAPSTVAVATTTTREDAGNAYDNSAAKHQPHHDQGETPTMVAELLDKGHIYTPDAVQHTSKPEAPASGATPHPSPEPQLSPPSAVSAVLGRPVARATGDDLFDQLYNDIMFE